MVRGLRIGIICIGLLAVAKIACGQCGKDRVAVKNMVDGFVAPRTPEETTIQKVCAIPKPKGKWLSLPRQESEQHYYKITGMLIGAGVEKDNDYHVILSDSRRTIVCEIPAPSCLPITNSHLNLYVKARSIIDSLMGRKLWKGIKPVKPRPITICGISFFDKIHGQKDVAPNGFELHPVFAVLPQ